MEQFGILSITTMHPYLFRTTALLNSISDDTIDDEVEEVLEEYPNLSEAEARELIDYN